jgi:hypothetical protein
MSWSYIPRGNFPDSPRKAAVPGAIYIGCTHDGHMPARLI